MQQHPPFPPSLPARCVLPPARLSPRPPPAVMGAELTAAPHDTPGSARQPRHRVRAAARRRHPPPAAITHGREQLPARPDPAPKPRSQPRRALASSY